MAFEKAPTIAKHQAHENDTGSTPGAGRAPHGADQLPDGTTFKCARQGSSQPSGPSEDGRQAPQRLLTYLQAHRRRAVPPDHSGSWTPPLTTSRVSSFARALRPRVLCFPQRSLALRAQASARSDRGKNRMQRIEKTFAGRRLMHRDGRMAKQAAGSRRRPVRRHDGPRRRHRQRQAEPAPVLPAAWSSTGRRPTPRARFPAASSSAKAAHTTHEILSARIIDRSIRPLFPGGLQERSPGLRLRHLRRTRRTTPTSSAFSRPRMR